MNTTFKNSTIQAAAVVLGFAGTALFSSCAARPSAGAAPEPRIHADAAGSRGEGNIPQASGAAAELQAPEQGAWPNMHLQKGSYFSYQVPEGWQAHESTNGVDLLSPDGSEGVSFVGLEGTPGSSSPSAQIEKIAQILGTRNFRYTVLNRRPFQNGFNAAEFHFTCINAKGQQCEGWAWSAVNNSYGRNNAYSEIACAPVDVWRRDAQFLVAAARLIQVTNPQQAFQRDQLIRLHISVGPGSAGGFNHPNTFTPYSNQAAMDRISDQRSRTTRGDYPLTDPSTGRTYHGTSDNYDYVRGGWVNPQDHTQLLQVVPLGK